MAQGFVVLAVEHADGTAATVQLAGGAGHHHYSGWLSEEERMDQTRQAPGSLCGQRPPSGTNSLCRVLC